MVSPEAVALIKKLVPDPRFVFIFRNPIDRAWSHYSWATGRYGLQPQTFRDAFLDDVRNGPRRQWPVNLDYYHNGRYDRWLRMYLDTFGADRICIVIFEDFVLNPLTTLNRIYRFLSVGEIDHLEPYRAMESEVMRFPMLRQVYSEIGRLGGKLVSPLLPHPLQVKLIRIYQTGDRQIANRISVGRPPGIDDDTRAWLADFYDASVDSLRTLISLPITAWEREFPIDQPRPH
jgi:hypothetical protein